MLCKKCGQEIPDSDQPLNCPHCGEPLESGKAADSVNPDQEAFLEEAGEFSAEEEEDPSLEPTEEVAYSPDMEQEEPEEAASDPELEGQGENMEPDWEQKPAPKKRTPLALAIGAAVLVLVLCAVLFMGRSGGQTVTADQHASPSSLRYQSESGVSLIRDGGTIQLFTNGAGDLSAHGAIANQMSSFNPYIGKQNYVKFANGEIVYIETVFTGVNEQTGQPDVTGKLYLKAPGQEPTLLDEDVQVIYCANQQELFYTKLEGNKLVEYHYKDGKTQKADEITGQPNSIVIEISEDSSLLGALFLDDSGQIKQAGYLKDGTLHYIEDGVSLYGISPDGKQVYGVESDPATSLVTLYRVKDLSTGELEQIGTAITEVLQYGDTGSVAFVGDCDVSKGKANPAGSLFYFDAQSGETKKLADDVTAIVEAFPRTRSSLNENGQDLLPSETSSVYTIDSTLYPGQIHYFDSVGNLKVINDAAVPGESGLDGMVLCAKMYEPESYSLSQDVYFMTQAGEFLYWSKGPMVYRYRLGSMEAPQTVPLDEDIQAKANASAQMGYIITGSGDIIEETGDQVILRQFEKEQTTPILENMGTLAVIGLDNDGKNIFFLTQDNSLYSKSVESRSNPKRIASNVRNAVATTDGLYILRDYEDGKGGTLDLLRYGEKSPVQVAEGVKTITAVTYSK